MFYSSRSEVNKVVVPRELSRANSSEIYICIYIVEDVRAVAWQQRNKALMTSDKRMMGMPKRRRSGTVKRRDTTKISTRGAPSPELRKVLRETYF